MGKKSDAAGAWRGIAADDRWRFQRLAREGARRIERLWVHDRPAVIKAVRRQLAALQPRLAMDWQADMLGDALDLTARDRERREALAVAPRKAKAKRPARGQLPTLATAQYSIHSITAKARLMRWDNRQALAAEGYLNCFDLVETPRTGALDLDRVRGSGPGLPATAAQVEAAARLKEAAAKLGLEQMLLLRLIIGEGLTITELARRRQVTATRAEQERLGHEVKAALTALADHWKIGSGGHGIESWVGEYPTNTRPAGKAEIIPGRAHVGERRR